MTLKKGNYKFLRTPKEKTDLMNILNTYLKLKKLLKRVRDKLVLIFRTKKVLSIVVMEKTLRNITLCFQLSIIEQYNQNQ